jgi:hypothetical protein
MPPDTELTEELITRYDEARKALAGANDDRAVPLLLHSFGEGDGFGVYQLVEDTLWTYPRETVTRALAAALRSPISSVRAWSMEVALEYPDPRLLPHAIHVLETDDPNARFFAAAFLGLLPDRDVNADAALRRALDSEDDPDVRVAIREALASRITNGSPRDASA